MADKPLGEMLKDKLDDPHTKPNLEECPICDTRNWTIEDPLQVHGIGDQAKFTLQDGRTFTPVLCQECGYTITFDVHVAGLMDQPDQS